MGKYIIRRLLQMIPVIIGATFLIFAMVFALRATHGRTLRRAALPARLRRGVPGGVQPQRPAAGPVRQYMGNLVQGDLGTNFYGNRSSTSWPSRWPTTLKLALMARPHRDRHRHHRRRARRHPAGQVHRQPGHGEHPVRDLDPDLRDRRVAPADLRGEAGLFPVTATQGTFYELILPGFVLASASLAYVARLTRTNLAENLRADYVRTAIAKGLPGAGWSACTRCATR